MHALVNTMMPYSKSILFKLLLIVSLLLVAPDALKATVPSSAGTTFMPAVIENARELMPAYPSAATLVLSELSRSEERKIVNLIQDESRVYLTIKRAVLVARSNWRLVGSKGEFNIWQLHIKSPDAVGMQAFFRNAILPAELKIKVYSGQKSVTSHVGEYLSDGSKVAKNFWSTSIPGDTIVIEVWVHSNSKLAPETFPFEIESINHYFRGKRGELPPLKYHLLAIATQQNTCALADVDCMEDTQRAYSAIGYMRYTRPDDHVAQCTGSFLNNSDKELYFLTAFHCLIPGISEDSTKGSDLNAEIQTSLSSCATADDKLFVDDVKFIAASEIGDWALLWVNKKVLQRADGMSSTATAPHLLGWDSNKLAVNSQLENLHHAEGEQLQHHAILRMTELRYHNPGTPLASFDTCLNDSACSHYALEVVEGKITGSASGSPLWDDKTTDKDYKVRAVVTHRHPSLCRAFGTRFDKINEDGRVQCALTDSNAYYPGNTSVCDDSARPIYNNDPPPTPLPPCTADLISSYTDNDGVDQKYDVDKDDDGLIEICDLEGLNEIRNRPDGAGYYSSTASFAVASGCSKDHRGTPEGQVCIGLICITTKALPIGGMPCRGYELSRDLDFNNPAHYRNAKANMDAWTTTSTSIGWQPIGYRGSASDQFSGVFEGNDKTISNLFIRTVEDIHTGLFSQIKNSAEINNLKLLNVNIKGNNFVGSLVGTNRGVVSNSDTTKGRVEGGLTIGGLVGYNDGIITGSRSSVDVIGENTIGGLVGSNMNAGTISSSEAAGRVVGEEGVGGLVGNSSGMITDSRTTTGSVVGLKRYTGGLVGFNTGTISGSDATSNVTGNNEVGGLIGHNIGMTVHNYSSGSVTGENEIGGLIGKNWGTISNSHTAIHVNGNNNVGGLVGENRGTISSSNAASRVEGNRSVGGLVGYNLMTITDSYVTAVNIRGLGERSGGLIGGLVGYNLMTITDSYVTAVNIRGLGERRGGLVGYNAGTISNSYAASSVVGKKRYAGGLVSINVGEIVNSYSAGHVKADAYVGGLVGWNVGNGTISGSYAANRIEGNNNVGGLVGSNHGTVVRSYWDKTVAKISTSDSVSYTTERMQSPTAPGTTSTSIYYMWSNDDWDFGDSDQYPVLRYSKASPLSGSLLSDQRYVLSNLILENAILSPPFSHKITEYTMITSSTTVSTRITPIANHREAIITINNEEVPDGMPSNPIELKQGIAAVITVSSEDKSQITTYTLSVSEMKEEVGSFSVNVHVKVHIEGLTR